MQSLETKSSRPKSSETETRSETFETETKCRDSITARRSRTVGTMPDCLGQTVEQSPTVSDSSAPPFWRRAVSAIVVANILCEKLCVLAIL